MDMKSELKIVHKIEVPKSVVTQHMHNFFRYAINDWVRPPAGREHAFIDVAMGASVSGCRGSSV
jgi:hypothetical protein